MLKFLVCYSCLTCTISYRKGSQVHGPMTPRASRARSWIGLCHEITFSFHTLCHPFHDILSFDDINYSISYLSIRSTTLRTNPSHSDYASISETSSSSLYSMFQPCTATRRNLYSPTKHIS